MWPLTLTHFLPFPSSPNRQTDYTDRKWCIWAQPATCRGGLKNTMFCWALAIDWTEWVDEGDGVDSIYLDFSKAFDFVPHSRLIQKLENLGIRGQILSWISAFLQDRRQRVLLKNGTSDWEPVISGVPQGSIIGPVLFLLYVNNLPDTTQNTAKMFADNTKLYSRISDIQECEQAWAFRPSDVRD